MSVLVGASSIPRRRLLQDRRQAFPDLQRDVRLSEKALRSRRQIRVSLQSTKTLRVVASRFI